MKKLLIITGFLIASRVAVVEAQIFNKDKLKFSKDKDVSKEVPKSNEGGKESPAEVAINGVKYNIKKLDELFKNPKWTDIDYTNKIVTQLNEMEGKIASIKRDDPKYDVKDFEKKYAQYKEDYHKGLGEGDKQMGKATEYAAYNRRIERIMRLVDGIAYADSYSDMVYNNIRNSTLTKLKDSLLALSFQSTKGSFKKEELKELGVSDLNNQTVLNAFTFEGKLKSSAIYAVTNQYEKRAAKFADDIGERFVVVDQGLAFIDIIMPHLSSQDLAELKTKRSEFETAVKKDKEYLKSNISTGAYHDTHYNQLVFTNEGMKIGAENAAAEKKEFSSKENIYVNVYLNEKVSTTINTDWQYAEAYIKLNIDGKDIEVSLPFDLTQADMNKSAYCLPLLPSPENNSQPHVSYWAAKTFKDLSIGKHKVMAIAKFGKKTVVNEFILTIEDKSVMENRYEVFETKRGDLFKVPGKAGTFAPADVTTDIKKIVQSDSEGKLSVLKLISYNNDWSIEKNKYTGVILKRFLEFGMIVKDANGKCWYQGEQFYQEYAGGKYTKTMRGATIYTRERINCSAAK